MDYFQRRAHRARVVRDAVRSAVVEGRWDEGRLPSEDELERMFDVGRNVVREALHGLVAEGLLVRHQGQGTRPTSRIVLHSTDRLRTLSENSPKQRKSREIYHRLLRWEEVPASPLHAQSLGVPDGTPVICMERVTAAETPLIFWSCFLRSDLGLHQPAEVGHVMLTSFYSYLEASGLRIAEGRVRTSAIACDEAVADLLDVPVGSPALLQNRALLLEDGTVAESSTGYYRADQIALVSTFAR